LPPSRSRQSGFTLLELMVVLVLIAIMTALIIPEMRGTLADAQLRSTARELVGVFNLAYSQAVTVNRPHRVRIDPRARRYQLEWASSGSEQSGRFAPVTGINGCQGTWDEKIRLEIRKSPRSPQAPDEEQLLESGVVSFETILFLPDGTADSTEIHLEDQTGSELVLAIHPTTARVRIIESQGAPIP
jgi:type II secretion system protein H